MNKETFLNELRNKLVGLPKDDVENRILFYNEMIEDYTEDGKTEEEAINEIGSVDDIIKQIADETSLFKLVKEKTKPKRRINTWEILLIILGFPIWLPLLITAFILVLVAYILLWVLVIITYSIELSLIVGSIYMLIGFFGSGFNFFYLGGAMFSIGSSISMIFACAGATKISIKLTKKIILAIKQKIVTRG